MVLVALLLAILVGTIFAIATAIVEAFIIRWILPFTGLPYDPSYWQAFFFAVLFNIMIAWAGAVKTSSSSN